MKLTMQGEYAIRAMVELAREHGSGLISARELAERQEIPPVFLTKILLILAKSGLIVSLRGSHGGIRLAKEPSAISIREVIEAVEGPLRLNSCIGDGGPCGRTPECKVHKIWNKAQSSMLRELNISLSELT
ncbi:MAG: Rrf2 family transcriptional regulator [Rubrobacteridae bacterium]|nr:Rrf2 family transcriptional regulator [Rubrobacteridae bacterium]